MESVNAMHQPRQKAEAESMPHGRSECAVVKQIATKEKDDKGKGCDGLGKASAENLHQKPQPQHGKSQPSKTDGKLVGEAVAISWPLVCCAGQAMCKRKERAVQDGQASRHFDEMPPVVMLENLRCPGARFCQPIPLELHVIMDE